LIQYLIIAFSPPFLKKKKPARIRARYKIYYSGGQAVMIHKYLRPCGFASPSFDEFALSAILFVVSDNFYWL